MAVLFLALLGKRTSHASLFCLANLSSSVPSLPSPPPTCCSQRNFRSCLQLLHQMDDEASTDAAASAAFSPSCTDPMDCNLMENKLMLAARSISICRKAMLQQAVKTLGFSMHETTTQYNESNEVLTTIYIEVPPQIRVARLKKRLFHGDWSTTTDAAVQSACFNVLVYLQKVKVLIIDGIHSAELKKCQTELLRASSWAEAFQQHADKLQSRLSEVVKEKNPVLNISQAPSKVSTPSTSTFISKHKSINGQEQPLVPSASTNVAQNVGNKEIPFVSPSEIPWTHQTVNTPHFPRTRKNFWGPPRGPMPRPEPALAAFNREKRKLALNFYRSREKNGPLPSLPLLDSSSPGNKYTAVIDLCDEVDHVRPDHVDPEGTFTSLTTPPSANKTTTLSTRSGLLDSKVRKPMFQDDEGKGKETDLEEKVLEKDTDYAETYEAVKDTMVSNIDYSESTIGPTPLPPDKKHRSLPTEGAISTSVRKTGC